MLHPLSTSSPFSSEQLDKLGNTIVYLANSLGLISKTKLLKLLYLIEETSVKKRGLPFLNLPFEVWQFGPVVKDVFIDLNNRDVSLLSDYIVKQDFNVRGRLETKIVAIKGFDDDEFSDSDIELMDLVIETYGARTAKQLVTFTHRKNSPWEVEARESGLLEAFKKNQTTYSEIKIDFSRLVSDDSKDRYLDQVDFLSQTATVKVG